MLQVNTFSAERYSLMKTGKYTTCPQSINHMCCCCCCCCVWPQDVEEKVLMLKDAVLTPDCQLYYDYLGPHDRNLFGEPAQILAESNS
jgi:hypothetical protein